jgi:peptidoglycan/xylan/chitin deacetylase (PgdA/CDA1 family)
MSADKALVRRLKLAGSLIWHFGTVVRTKVRRLQGKPIPGSLVVLCYHAVPPNQRERFGRQMDLLQRHAKPIMADAEMQPLAGGRYVAVTFDDGYQSSVENALPELRARNIPCTFFVVSHLPGHSPWWSGTDGYDREDKFITTEQLADLPSDLVIIGSHTMTHPRLSALPEEMAKRELFESRELLQKKVRQKIGLLAFPHGTFNDAILTWCREAGYERVFSIEPTVAVANSMGYVIGRVIVNPTDWEIEFRLKVLGAYQWLPFAYRIKREIGSMLGVC